MVVTTFQKAEASRRNHTNQLQFLEDQLAAHVAAPIDEVTTDQLLQLTETLKHNLQANHEEHEQHAPAATDMIPIREEHNRLFTQAIRLFSSFKGIKMAFPPPAAAAAPPPPACTSHASQIRLPQIDLPSFSGDIQEWVSFRDTFETAVGNSSTLSKSQKLTYLKSCLSGEAARHVKSLVISDANFDIAWTALTDRYHNNRELLFCILKRLLNQQGSNGTPVSVRNLVDITKECIRSLEVLTIPVQHYFTILVYLLFQKLDAPSRELWEQYIKGTAIPKLQEMFDFLEQRARALAASGPTTNRNHHPSQQQQQQQQRPFQPRIAAHHSQTASKCQLSCNTNHLLYSCPKFHEMPATDRVKLATDLNLCKNCLSPRHHVDTCQNRYTCRHCNKRHHTLLHIEAQQQSPSVEQVSSQDAPQRNASSFHIQQLDPDTVELPNSILPTAVVRLHNPNHQNSFARCLLDNGSTNSFITIGTIRRLGMQHLMKPYNISLSGLQDTPCGNTKGIIKLTISPHFNSSQSFNITALVVQKICNDIPPEVYRQDLWPHLATLQLADTKWYIPAPVDMLIGSEVFWDLLLPQKLSGPDHDGIGCPKAFNSHLGWLVAGEVIGADRRKVTCKLTTIHHNQRQGCFSETSSDSQPKLTTSNDLLPCTTLPPPPQMSRPVFIPAPWMYLPVYSSHHYQQSPIRYSSE